MNTARTMGFNASESDLAENETDLLAVRLSAVVFALHLLIVVVGVPGNFLILLVFWAKPRRTSTAVLIMALAAADLFACLARLCEVVYQGMQLAGAGPPRGLYAAITVVNNLSLTMVALMTAVIALDRYDCVCRHRKRLMSHRRSCGAVAFVCCLSLLSNIPLFIYISGRVAWSVVVFAKQVLFYFSDVLIVMICYGKVYAAVRQHVRVGVARLRVAGDPSGCSETGASIPRNGSRHETAAPVSEVKQPPENLSAIAEVDAPRCSSSTGPSAVSFDPRTRRDSGVATVSRFVEVARSGRQDATSGSGESESPRKSRRASLPEARRVPTSRGAPSDALQRRTTRMLFLATVIFLLTYIPYWAYVFMNLSGRPHDVAFQVMGNVLHLLFLNNAVNPLIYGLANRRFRKDVGDVLRKMCGRKPAA